MSASTVARLKAQWQGELAAWGHRRVDELEVVSRWGDGVYVKAGLEKDKAALLVGLAGLSDGTKVLLSVVPGHRESTESWASVLRDLRARGMSAPQLVIGDGHLGIWGALRNVYPEAAEPRWWTHRLLTVLDQLPTRQQAQATRLLRQIPYAETRAEAKR